MSVLDLTYWILVLFTVCAGKCVPLGNSVGMQVLLYLALTEGRWQAPATTGYTYMYVFAHKSSSGMRRCPSVVVSNASRGSI